jgi:sarcosine oxidase subunit gamma
VIERHSALAAHHLMQHGNRIGSPWNGEAPVTLAEHRHKTIMQVSAFPIDIAEASERLRAIVGLEPPGPNRFSGDSDNSIRNFGPGIWQIVGQHGTSLLADTLRKRLQGVATVVDLTHARTTFRIQGLAARATLAKHCSLNLHLANFPRGSATMTRYGAVSVALACIHETPMFELMVSRGYAEFVLESLVKSASEYGLLISP